jgi:tripeptide aminopeptidase
MRLGRLDEETTANVGVIEGGSSTNVVAGSCRIDAEARSLDEGKAADALAAMVDACTHAASAGACDVDLETTEVFRGYRVPSSARSVRIATAALERCGHLPTEVATGGGSDANALMAQGFECVLLANGTEANHTPDESVAARRIVDVLAICEAIVELAAEGEAG